MPKSFVGGCACGAIRYDVSGEPMIMLDCQCRQCQHDSGTGHGSHIAFKHAEVTISGDASFWVSVGDGGTVKRRAFCPTCGAPVYMTFPERPEQFSIPAASLDDPGLYSPQIILWTDTGHAWDRIDPGLPRFARMPPAS